MRNKEKGSKRYAEVKVLGLHMAYPSLIIPQQTWSPIIPLKKTEEFCTKKIE